MGPQVLQILILLSLKQGSRTVTNITNNLLAADI